MESWMDRQKDGQKDGQMERRTDEWTKGTEENYIPLLAYFVCRGITISAIFDLQIAQILPTKFLLVQEKNLE